METWLWFWDSGLGVMVVTLIFNTLVNMMLIFGTFYLAKQEARIQRIAPGATIIGLLQLIPMICVVNAYKGQTMNAIVYCLALFPCPILLWPYYLIYHHLFRAPPGMIPMALEWLLMGQYISLLLYALLDNLLAGLLHAHLYWRALFIPDYLALFAVAILGIVLYRVTQNSVNRSKDFLNLPYDYVPEHMLRTVGYAMVLSTTTYIMLVCVRVIFFGDTQYHFSFSLETILLHLFLFCLQVIVHVDRYYRNRRIVIEWQAKQTERYIQSLLRTTTEFRRVKHDFYNILQTYGGYIALRDLDALQNYHQTLTNATVEAGERIDMINALRERPPLYTLFDIKQRLAQQCGVELRVNRIGALADAAINDFDLCRILSNLLDNAIQAAEESKERDVTVDAQRQGNEVHVEIRNPTSGLVEIERALEDGYTTKAAHSGQGLGSVKSILHHYKNCMMEMRYSEKSVTVFLRLEAN